MTASRPNSRLLRARSHRASQILHSEYGSPNHRNKKNPLDELVFIILSLMTTHHSFNRVYLTLKRQVKKWDKLTAINVKQLALIIKDGGLSNQKAVALIKIMKRIKLDFGTVTLAPLKVMTDEDMERYLTSLPGVGVSLQNVL